MHEKALLAFNAYDRNRDGYLTKAEMKKTSKMMTEAQIDAVFDKYDKNKDGKLSFEEFKHLMESHNKEKRSQASHHQPPETSQSASASTTTSEVTLTNEWFVIARHRHIVVKNIVATTCQWGPFPCGNVPFFSNKIDLPLPQSKNFPYQIPLLMISNIPHLRTLKNISLEQGVIWCYFLLIWWQ